MSEERVHRLTDATVVLDDDGTTTRHEDVNASIYDGWVIVEHIDEIQVVPRERVQEVFSR